MGVADESEPLLQLRGQSVMVCTNVSITIKLRHTLLALGLLAIFNSTFSDMREIFECSLILTIQHSQDCRKGGLKCKVIVHNMFFTGSHAH